MGHYKTIQIGLLGLGTVGTGVVKSLLSNQQPISEQTGCLVAVKRALIRDVNKSRDIEIQPSLITTDGNDVVNDPEISIVIEVMGGIEPAKSLITKALLLKKHVITANKELLAKHGDTLMALAHEQGVRLMFEASVGGGIPIVHMVQSYLTANRIFAIQGILNGTCNYILTQMDEMGQSFSSALATAQALGYAEADPESDVEGFDAAYKLSILANIAFPIYSSIQQVQREGITKITAFDIANAKELGAVIKLIGHATYQDGEVQLTVGPRMLPRSHSLASVRDVFNAVTVSADVVGDLTFIGRGAGELPTASAVIEDLVETLRTPKPQGRRQQIRDNGETQKTSRTGVMMYYLRVWSQIVQYSQDIILTDQISSHLRTEVLWRKSIKETSEIALVVKTEDIDAQIAFLNEKGFACALTLPFDGILEV